MSSDGRYIAFSSAATNIASGAPAGRQVYLRDTCFGASIDFVHPFDATCLYGCRGRTGRLRGNFAFGQRVGTLHRVPGGDAEPDIQQICRAGEVRGNQCEQ